MLLTLTLSQTHASDLGYLLGKNPSRSQSFPLAFGQAHVFYPEVSSRRCTAALLLDVDPVGLVRNSRSGQDGLLQQYVNDRPYVASSFLSVAIAQVYGSALQGRSRERPALAQQVLPLTATMAVLPCRGGERFLRGLFEPLGYQVTARQHPLDERFPAWGASPYFTVSLSGMCLLSDLLSHLYVLVPVLDNDKHYYVAEQEVEKLLRHGEGWLGKHPLREEITRRYLKHQGSLTRSALARLTEETETDEEAEPTGRDVEERLPLHEQRLTAVVQTLVQLGARKVVDLGCGEGKLLRLLGQELHFSQIVGVDVSTRALEIARQRLEKLPISVCERIQLLHGSLMYRDSRLAGFDAAAVVEVIEHLDPARLSAFERVVFAFARPASVVVTTPNREYNVRFESLASGTFRHPDHRFEWTRSEFQLWAEGVAKRFGYRVRFMPIGSEDAEVGAPTQMAVFERNET